MELGGALLGLGADARGTLGNARAELSQEIAFQVDAQGLSIRQAAEQWIDQNPDVWRPWVS